MQQLTFIRSGHLERWEVPVPSLQHPGQAIVRPITVATCDLDAALIRGQAPFPGPFAFGHEFFAEVLQVGEAVQQVAPEQLVIVPFQISCGTCARCQRGKTGDCLEVPALSMYGLAPVAREWGGALSDLVLGPFAEAILIPLPDDIAPATIASASDNLPDAWRTVGPHLEDQPGASVLIVGEGASGSVGLYAVAIARALGASQVDYCDRDPGRLEVAQDLGATPLEVSGTPQHDLVPIPLPLMSVLTPRAFHARSVQPHQEASARVVVSTFAATLRCRSLRCILPESPSKPGGSMLERRFPPLLTWYEPVASIQSRSPARWHPGRKLLMRS